MGREDKGEWEPGGAGEGIVALSSSKRGDPGGVARRRYGDAQANVAWRTGGGVRARGGRALGWGARQGLPVAERRAPRGGRGRRESHGELPCGKAAHGSR